MTAAKASWDDSVDLTPQGCDRALQGCSLGVAGSSPQKMVKMSSLAYLAIQTRRMTFKLNSPLGTETGVCT